MERVIGTSELHELSDSEVQPFLVVTYGGAGGTEQGTAAEERKYDHGDGECGGSG